VDNTSRAKLHDNKYVNNVEERCILCKKIAGIDFAFVIFYKRSPSLTSLQIARSNRISPNRARRMLDTEFDLQLLVYLIFSPSEILSAYSFDKLDMFARYSWPTDLIGSRSPTPMQSEPNVVTNRQKIVRVVLYCRVFKLNRPPPKRKTQKS